MMVIGSPTLAEVGETENENEFCVGVTVTGGAAGVDTGSPVPVHGPGGLPRPPWEQTFSVRFHAAAFPTGRALAGIVHVELVYGEAV
jgi:hypothetical protein